IDIFTINKLPFDISFLNGDIITVLLDILKEKIASPAQYLILLDKNLSWSMIHLGCSFV
ncbi:283_t:CDS:2, partial [Dentiscutata heterogama]